jgi:hypothetical protein
MVTPLSLPLFVSGVAADDEQLAVTTDQLTVLADPFHA